MEMKSASTMPSSSSLSSSSHRKTKAPPSSSVVHEACQLLENSLSALVADASVLRQLTALRHEIQRGSGNTNKKGNVSKDLHDQLLRIDRVVSELEDKMQIFRDVVKEEQKAIAEIETYAIEAQSKVVEFQALQERIITNGMEETTSLDSRHEEKGRGPSNAASFNDSAHASDNSETPDEHDHPYYGDSRRYEYTKYDDMKDFRRHFIKLDLITQEEFLRVPRATRAHISRALANEAVLDIERTFQEKEMLRLKNKRKRAIYTWNKGEDEEQALTCSEQEMRSNCAFFRSGESSARGVLMILRHLNRIKQIHTGNGQIVYALP